MGVWSSLASLDRSAFQLRDELARKRGQDAAALASRIRDTWRGGRWSRALPVKTCLAILMLALVVDLLESREDGFDAGYVLISIPPALPLIACLVDRRWCWALLAVLGLAMLLPTLVLFVFALRVDWLLANVVMLVLGIRNALAKGQASVAQ